MSSSSEREPRKRRGVKKKQWTSADEVVEFGIKTMQAASRRRGVSNLSRSVAVRTLLAVLGQRSIVESPFGPRGDEALPSELIELKALLLDLLIMAHGDKVVTGLAMAQNRVVNSIRGRDALKQLQAQIDEQVRAQISALRERKIPERSIASSVKNHLQLREVEVSLPHIRKIMKEGSAGT